MGLLQAIGHTPLIELSHFGGGPRVRLLCKLEGVNPGGSVKDRPALRMIEAAERSGELTPQKTIIEATSGNTGIALAMIGAARGYRVTLYMSAGASIERRRVLAAMGARVLLSPAHEGTDGAIRLAHQLVDQSPDEYYMPNQFDNPYNVLAHYESTGPELFHDTHGEIDVFVAGMGTTGTLMGVSRFFREHKPGVKIVGVEPPVGHRIQGLKNMQEAIRPKVYDPELLDEKVTVDNEEAFAAARWLAAKEGIFVGMSSGAALAGAMKVAQRIASGTIVVLLPDRGDRYLSTELFEPTGAEDVGQSRAA